MMQAHCSSYCYPLFAWCGYSIVLLMYQLITVANTSSYAISSLYIENYGIAYDVVQYNMCIVIASYTKKIFIGPLYWPDELSSNVVLQALVHIGTP